MRRLPERQRTRGTSRTLATIVLTALIAGCGGGGGSSPEESAASEAPENDVCTLLTGADIQEVLGTSAGEGTAENEALGQCSWSATDGSTPLVVVTLDDAVLRSFDDFVMNFGVEFGGENPPEEEYHPVQGVPGDWAMYVAEDHMVRAFRGELVLEVSADGAEEAQVVDLATRAMGRLP